MKRIFILLFTLLSFAGFGQVVLTNTTHTLEVTTSGTAGIDYRITYYDETSSGAGITTTSVGKITTAATTTVLSAPAASTTRTVQYATFTNIGSAENTITIKVDVSAVEYNETPPYTLKGGESLYYNPTIGWYLSNPTNSTVSGQTKNFSKTSTVSDATGYWYGFWKDAGIPGAWAPGTPGVNGRVTDGTTATDAGCIFFTDAGAGKVRYLTEIDINSSATVSAFSLWDVVWVNSGITVTTTTEQTFTTPTFPARDANGTTNGEGYMIGVYATAALGNAGVVSNSTIRYTNSAGTGSRTATLSATVPQNFPATPVIGTVVWFDLAAGDTGVQSIQGITLATTLTSGSLSIFVARRIVDAHVSLVNSNGSSTINDGWGVPLYDNACLLLFAQTAATTATVINGNITTVER
jgi:hypothetical protein